MLPGSPKVLVVEDDPRMMLMLNSYLDLRTFHVYSALLPQAGQRRPRILTAMGLCRKSEVSYDGRTSRFNCRG